MAVSVPEGYYGRLAGRSGLCLASGIIVGGGVIDEDYRGGVGIIILNMGEEDFVIRRGDRVAQLIIEKILSDVEWEECETLEETARGEDGFGSTGGR